MLSVVGDVMCWASSQGLFKQVHILHSDTLFYERTVMNCKSTLCTLHLKMSFKLLTQEFTAIVAPYIPSRLSHLDQGIIHFISLKQFSLLKYEVSFRTSLFATNAVDKWAEICGKSLCHECIACFPARYSTLSHTTYSYIA